MVLGKYPLLRLRMERGEREWEAARAEIKRQVDGALPRLAAAILGMAGVRGAWMFGSFAAQHFRPGSDLDIAVDAPEWTYVDLFAAQRGLERETGLPIHLNLRADLAPETLESEGVDLHTLVQEAVQLSHRA